MCRNFELACFLKVIKTSKLFLQLRHKEYIFHNNFFFDAILNFLIGESSLNLHVIISLNDVRKFNALTHAFPPGFVQTPQTPLKVPGGTATTV